MLETMLESIGRQVVELSQSSSTSNANLQESLNQVTEAEDFHTFNDIDDIHTDFNPNEQLQQSVTVGRDTNQIDEPEEVELEKKKGLSTVDKPKLLRNEIEELVNATKKEELKASNEIEECSNQELVNATKKEEPKASKTPKFVYCQKCKFKCSQNFNEEDRVNLCSSYWKLETYSHKKDFILGNVKSCIPEILYSGILPKEDGKTRTNFKQFYFLKNGNPTRVCQNFFLKTLSISKGLLNRAFEYKNETTELNHENDKHDKHEPANKSSPDKSVINEPEQDELERKKKRSKKDESESPHNIIKKCKNLEMSDATKKGPEVSKTPQLVDCKKCKFKCSQNFSEEDRAILCSSYWNLETYSRKKDFILKNVISYTPQRQRLRKSDGKARTNSKQFYFLKNGNPTRVCQNFFLKTLSISNGPLNKAFENRNQITGLYQGDDKRGKHEPANKLSKEDRQFIKNHIEKFPLTESHCGKSTQKKYLDATLSIAKMYTLYKELCNESGKVPCSISTYKRIFCHEYNYSFFKLCLKYQSANSEQKAAQQSNSEEHKCEIDGVKSKEHD